MSFKQHLPNTMTLLNAFNGLIAILFILQKQYNYAIIFILIAIILDYFDGYVARLLKVDSKIGLQLDSLADIVSFGVAPYILFIVKYNYNLFIILAGIMYVLAGIYRLAGYNIGARKTKTGFVGLPITFSAILMMIISYVPYKELVAVLMLAISYLMISKLNIKKLTL